FLAMPKSRNLLTWLSATPLAGRVVPSLGVRVTARFFPAFIPAFKTKFSTLLTQRRTICRHCGGLALSIFHFRQHLIQYYCHGICHTGPFDVVPRPMRSTDETVDC